MTDTTEIAKVLSALIAPQDTKIQQLEESLADKIAQLDAIGWKEIGSAFTEGDGPALEDIQAVTERLREMASSNPLHVRGAQLRFSYIFGEGVNFNSVKAAAQKVMDNPYNKEVLFSVTAFEKNNLASFTDGNLVVIYDTKDQLFTALPLKAITAVRVDPNDQSKIRYIKRSFLDEDGQDKQEWVPLARWKKSLTKGLPTKFKDDNDDINQTQTAYVKRSRAQTGWTWGVPDSLAAMIWSLAYSAYLQDNSKLVRALSMIAWSLTKTTAEGVNTAAAQIVGSNVGGTAVNTTGNAISSVGVPSSQVNMNNGQPLAAMVATSFGVSVIALLSSPGATGGSYGAATTLDGPQVKGTQADQEGWGDFYTEILHDLGSAKATVTFPNIEGDPAYREAQSIATAHSFGLIHTDEAREGTLKVLRVPKLHDEMPPKPAVVPNANSGPKAPKPASQGNSGPVPGGAGQGVSDHTGDNNA